MTVAVSVTTMASGRVSPPPGGRHLPALALIRFLAVAAVIWTHAAGPIKWMGTGFDFADAGRFGSAFFTQCSVFLVMLKAFSRADLTWLQNARGRFFRVYVPFLLWSIIYAVQLDLKALFLHEGERFEFDRSFFWNGSIYHLWFLPFILIVGIVLFGFARWLMRAPKLAIPMAVLLVFAGCLAGAIYFPIEPDTFDRDYMLRLSWNRIPSVCWAAAFAIFFQFGGRELLRTRGMLMLGIGVFAGSLFMLGTHPWLHVFENLSGVGGMLIGLSILNAAQISWASALGKLTYGMYLCHLLFLGLFRTLWHKGMGATNNYTFAVVATFLTVCASAVASAYLARTRQLKVLVPV